MRRNTKSRKRLGGPAPGEHSLESVIVLLALVVLGTIMIMFFFRYWAPLFSRR